MAPPDATSDPLWKWFLDIHSKGMTLLDRTNNRKNGSIVLYDSAHTEVARFNFFNGWPTQDRDRRAQHRLERPGEGDGHDRVREPRAGQVVARAIALSPHPRK